LSSEDQLSYECPLSFVVVTPNYNMVDYLEETIQSVLRNLDPGDEYFIVDGGSTDGSVEMIKKYENRISGWISEPDEGYADALRKGFEMSSVPLMCWINSGDLLLSGTLNLVRNRFACSNADLLFADDYYIDENGAILQHSNGYVKDLRKMMLFGRWTPLQDACYWRRSLYDLIGGIDSTIRYAADYDFFLRMSMKGHYEYFSAVLSAFRRHYSQKSIAGADAYALERKRIRFDTLSGRNISGLIDYFFRMIYRIYAYLRAHVRHLNQKKSECVGVSITGIVAKPLIGMHK